MQSADDECHRHPDDESHLHPDDECHRHPVIASERSKNGSLSRTYFCSTASLATLECCKK